MYIVLYVMHKNNVNTALARGGYRIRRRTLKTQKVPKSSKITQSETIDFFKKKFNVNVI